LGCKGSCTICDLVFISVYWRLKRFHVIRCSWRFIGIRQVTHVEQELLTLPGPLSSTPVFCGVHVTQSLNVCVGFCRSLFVILSFVTLLRGIFAAIDLIYLVCQSFD